MPPGHFSFASSLASSYASVRLPHSSHSFGEHSHGHGQPPSTDHHFSPYGSPSFVNSPAPKPEVPPDVAGWIKAYHPGFVLQALRPYQGLKKDIMASLRAEARLSAAAEDNAEPSSSAPGGPEQGRETGSDGEWTDVASVLLADATRFVVERHTLRRRRHEPERVESSTDLRIDDPESHNPMAATKAALTNSPSSMQEEIFTEPIADMDPTLIDAVERLLAQSGPPSHTASGAQSRASSRAASPSRSRPVSVKGRETRAKTRSSTDDLKAKITDTLLLQHVPFAECRRIMLTALQTVARSVLEDREAEEQEIRVGKKVSVGAGGDDGGGAREGRGKAKNVTAAAGEKMPVEGTLREGVRRWLEKVEGDEW